MQFTVKRVQAANRRVYMKIFSSIPVPQSCSGLLNTLLKIVYANIILCAREKNDYIVKSHCKSFGCLFPLKCI